MYVIKVEKSWSAGSSSGYVVQFGTRADSNAEYYAERWCWDKCLGGHSNGFEFNWTYIDDPQEVRSALLAYKKELNTEGARLSKLIGLVDQELGIPDKCRLFEVWCDGGYGIESRGPDTYRTGVTRVYYDEESNQLHVHLRRPGLLIGKAGNTIKELSEYLDCEVHIHEVKTLFY
jgi:hypothetical protein